MGTLYSFLIIYLTLEIVKYLVRQKERIWHWLFVLFSFLLYLYVDLFITGKPAVFFRLNFFLLTGFQ